MKFDKLVHLRYSVRRFDKRPVEEGKIEAILRAAQAAPSAKNKQSWRVLVINDALALEQLKTCTPCHYGAPLAFLVCCNKNEGFVREYDGAKSGVIDASIAATHMILAACELGVGSTWVMNFDPKRVREVYNMPDEYEPVALLVCGYPAKDVVIDKRHYARKPLEELCYQNTFTVQGNKTTNQEEKETTV